MGTLAEELVSVQPLSSPIASLMYVISFMRIQTIHQ